MYALGRSIAFPMRQRTRVPGVTIVLIAVTALGGAAPIGTEAQGSTPTFMQVRGVEIHYAESRPARPGEPWLLLLHGFGGNLQTWDDVTPALAADIRVVRLDLKGFGRSGKPRDDNYGPTEQAAIVAELIPRLGNGPVILGGHSYGGGVTLQTVLALRRSGADSLLQGLIFVDAATYPQKSPFFISQLRNPLGRFVVEHFTSRRWRTRLVLEKSYADPAQVTESRVDRYVWPLALPNAEYAFAMTARQIRIPNADAMPDSARTIAVPSLVLWCARDRVVPLENGRRLHQDIRGSQFVVIPDCGHIPQEEQPAAFLAAVRGFLGSL